MKGESTNILCSDSESISHNNQTIRKSFHCTFDLPSETSAFLYFSSFCQKAFERTQFWTLDYGPSLNCVPSSCVPICSIFPFAFRTHSIPPYRWYNLTLFLCVHPANSFYCFIGRVCLSIENLLLEYWSSIFEETSPSTGKIVNNTCAMKKSFKARNGLVILF